MNTLGGFKGVRDGRCEKEILTAEFASGLLPILPRLKMRQ